MKPTLVIMAAGLGSRYGSLKQIDAVGPNGEIIIDYSIYDAIRAGFGKIVFIIKKDIEDIFKEKIGNRVEKIIDTTYVYQNIEDIPKEIKFPLDRKKPWGTGHAILSCKNIIDTPFAVINADDFYGYNSFKQLYENLKDASDKDGIHYYMVGFALQNTLTEKGSVARGVCSVDKFGYLYEVNERTRIEKFRDTPKYTEDGVNWIDINKDSLVSMNTWGFTPSIFKELDAGFIKFMEKNKGDLLKAEFFLPEVVGNIIKEKKGKVKVLKSNEKWYGVTYKEDKPMVEKAISEMIKEGKYPENLWGGAK